MPEATPGTLEPPKAQAAPGSQVPSEPLVVPEAGAAPESQAAEDLDQRVESLLQQMEDAAKRAAGLAAESEAADAPGPVAPAPAEAELASQVDQLLAEASGAASAEPESIGSLDEELAKLASDLMEGDFASDTPVPSAPSEFRSSAPAAARPDPTIGDPPPIRHAAPAARVAPAPEPAPPPVPKGPSLWRRIFSAIGRAVVWTAGAVRRHTPTLLAILEPIAFRLASLVSAPLRNRPALVRDAVGWVAIGTAFWASCLFVYFLFMYQPDAPKPTSTAVGLVTPAEEGAEHEPASSHESGAKHEAAAPAHESKPEAAPVSGGHESSPKEHDAKPSGGHEGGTAEKAEPKKSPLKRPDKNPLGTVKKPEKKEEAAGGH